MKKKLKVNGPQGGSMIIESGNDFFIYIWGVDEIRFRLTKKGKVIAFSDNYFRKNGKFLEKTKVVQLWKSPSHFLRKLTNNNKNILITKNDDTSEYWDYCISENGLFE